MKEVVKMSGRWIHDWDPEDEEFWEQRGKRVARRNLAMSALTEHVGFSVWSLWSVLVLFMTPATGFELTPAQKFLLVIVPTLVGAVLRLPYRYAVTRLGGRNWTVFVATALLVPTALAVVVVQRPGTPLWVFLLVGATAGLGGGNFASSMTNMTSIFPRRQQGWALGLNAGCGNLGVAAVQLLGLLVAATAGVGHPALLAAVYLPLLVLVSLLAARRMDNFAAVRADPGKLSAAIASRHTWWLSLLYVGTFGSFIGFSFAFGLVLQYEFGATPLEAVSYTFLGPLLGSLFRPLGGLLADRLGGARVTLGAFCCLAAFTALLLAASAQHSFAFFVTAFSVLFVLSGIGNGSVYAMIPAVFTHEAEQAITAGHDAPSAFARTRQLCATVIAITGTLGTLGGVAVNLAFSFGYTGRDGSGDTAFGFFLAYYALCAVVTWAVYLGGRRTAESAGSAASTSAVPSANGASAAGQEASHV